MPSAWIAMPGLTKITCPYQSLTGWVWPDLIMCGGPA